MSLFLLSLFENFGPQALWNVLGRKSSQLFGKECSRSAIWMFFSLFIRLCVFLLGINSIIPNAIIFALPFWFQLLSRIFPFMKESIPLLHIRLAESILGRLSPSQLLVVFPAHFLGCILGSFLFSVLCPDYLSSVVLEPIVFTKTSFLSGLIMEIIVVTIFTILILITPELLHMNRLSIYWLSVIIFPFLYFIPYEESPILNPASVYALWYLKSRIMSTFSHSSESIQIEHVIGPIFGALIAGMICLKYFPDDPSSWKRNITL